MSEDKPEELVPDDEQLTEAFQKIFLSTPEGQLVLMDILNKCGVFKPHGVQNSSVYTLEGRREIGLYVLDQVEFQPVATRHPSIMQTFQKSVDTVRSVKRYKKKQQGGQ